jgi:hypothetical protein
MSTLSTLSFFNRDGHLQMSSSILMSKLDKLDISYFSIESGSNGIGNTLKLSYQTFVEDYPATVTVDLTDTGSW